MMLPEETLLLVAVLLWAVLLELAVINWTLWVLPRSADASSDNSMNTSLQILVR